MDAFLQRYGFNTNVIHSNLNIAIGSARDEFISKELISNQF
jgi:hypothetical protein